MPMYIVLLVQHQHSLSTVERERKRGYEERERERGREICVIHQKYVTVSQQAVTLKEFLLWLLRHGRDTKMV